MVDFQERDTSRGFRFDEDDEEAEEPPPEESDGEGEEPPPEESEEEAEESLSEESDGEAEEPPSGDSDEEGGEETEPDIDEVRERLEESPGQNGDAPRDDDDDGAATADPLTPGGAGDPTDGTAGADGVPVADEEAAGDDHEHAPDDHGGNHDHDGHDHDHDQAGHGEDGGEGGHDHAGHDDGGEADHDHHHAHDVDQLGVAAVTVSSSRTLADDPSGDAIVESMVDAGHDVVTRELIPDDYDDVQRAVDTLARRNDVDVVVTTGGTGVTPDDTTVEAVRPLLDKELPGFGELFRRLSYDDIGTKVVGTRATAGVAAGAPVFCLPGSTAAVELAVEEIITAEAPHLAGLARREEAPSDAE